MNICAIKKIDLSPDELQQLHLPGHTFDVGHLEHSKKSMK